MEKLAPGQKQVVKMRYYQGLDSVGIAGKLGIKATTARQTLARTRELLRRCIESGLKVFSDQGGDGFETERIS
jgi:DNA-directed RNA polymerase specialized sigma24 family protein